MLNNPNSNPSPALVSPSISTSIVMADGAWIGQTAGPKVTFDDTNNYLEITGCNVGINTAAPVNNKLHVYVTAGFDGTNGKGILIESEAGASGIGPALQFKNNDYGNWTVFARNSAYNTLAFYCNTYSAYCLELYNTSLLVGTDMWLYADYAGSGELPPGGFFGSRQDKGYFMVPSAEGGIAGTNTRCGLGYYNQTQWYTACETKNVASGFSTLLLMKSGGKVGLGTTAPDRQFEINSANGENLRLTYNDSNGSAVNYADFLMGATGGLTITSSLNNITFGNGVADTDLTFNFTGTTNSGIFYWMEDEDYFKFADNIHFGDGTNYLDISDSDGDIEWRGTFLKKLTLRPVLTQTTAKAAGTPTQVSRGLNIGYSLPIWSDPANINEELYWRMRIPIRWDGITDPQFACCVTLSAGEDAGDKFKFELQWQTTNAGDVLGTTTSSCYSEQTVLAGRNDAYDTYFVFFTFNADDANNPLVPGRMLQARLRRIAASSSEVSNEIIVWDWASMWPVAHVYGDWSVESNAT